MNAALILILILAAAVSFDAFCLVDLARADKVRYMPKWGWALVICVISAPVGGVIYLSVGRDR